MENKIHLYLLSLYTVIFLRKIRNNNVIFEFYTVTERDLVGLSSHALLTEKHAKTEIQNCNVETKM